MEATPGVSRPRGRRDVDARPAVPWIHNQESVPGRCLTHKSLDIPSSNISEEGGIRTGRRHQL